MRQPLRIYKTDLPLKKLELVLAALTYGDFFWSVWKLPVLLATWMSTSSRIVFSQFRSHSAPSRPATIYYNAEASVASLRATMEMEESNAARGHSPN
jgi:hypothetical protein